MADTYRYMGEYEKALYYAKRGIVTADSTVLASSLYTLAVCNYENDSLGQAKSVLNTIRYNSNDYLYKYLVFQNLSDIAIRQHNFDSLSHEKLKTHWSRKKCVCSLYIFLKRGNM